MSTTASLAAASGSGENIAEKAGSVAIVGSPGRFPRNDAVGIQAE
jgi:hypothetical protein